MKSTLALALALALVLVLVLMLGGLLVGCQPRTQSPAPRSAAPTPSMADYPPGSLGLRRHVDEASLTPFETIGAAATA